MIYNFRIDRNRVSEILRRLREEHLLSQGWGGGENGGLQIDQGDYVLKCKDFYKLATTRIPTNLTRMRDFRDNDLIVTPHLPENGKVLIHIIDGDFPACYDYLNNDPCHLNNRFKVKKSYGLDGRISIYNARITSWYGKLQWLRLPVLPIDGFEAGFRYIVSELEERPDAEFQPSKLEDFLESIRSELLDHLKGRLSSVSASISEISFEAICEYLLSSYGYRIENRHLFDGAGGDVDFRCVRERSDVSPFETGQTILFTQVKKHEGTTDDWAVRQLLSMLEKEPAADGCVMSLADDFTDEAQLLAKQNGILLMNGRAICDLLLQALAKQTMRD